MADILVRGKSKNGIWVVGGYLKHQKVIHCPLGATQESIDDSIVHLIIRDGMADWELPVPIEAIEVDPDTLSLGSDLQDKNGVAIFDGDIIKYRDYTYIMNYYDGGFWPDGIGRYRPIFPSRYEMKQCEVIGNKWDNPELLEVK